jgi:hypothetical protein
MKKQLLLLTITLLLLTATLQAQIKYWDFGAKELGTGYDNMLPLEYLNGFANIVRGINWADANNVVVENYADGVKYIPRDASYTNENGESPISCLNKSFLSRYETEIFQITAAGGADVGTSPGGVLISGSSAHTKPKLFPDLDGTTNMHFMKDSNSDRLYTVNKSVTRYDERNVLFDDMDPVLFPACLQFTTNGDKRYNATRGRGFGMTLGAGQWITVVGSGQYADIEGDGSLGFSTGYFGFESVGGTGTTVNIVDKGAGTGSPTGPIDGSDQGDEAVRVMQFQAADAGDYRLVNRGGKIRIYRIYLGQVDASLGSGLETKIYVNGVYSKTLSVDEKIGVSTNVKAVGNRIYVSNVKSSTEVKVYAITGALVKEFKTSSNMDFAFKSGLYIATVKTAEGQKSVKLLLN